MVHSEYSRLDISDFSEADRYKPMMGTVIPHPIALVTSLSRDGVLNAAPFGQFVVISVTSPLLGFVAQEVGFHTLSSSFVRASRIAESPVNFECRLRRTLQFGHQGSHTHLIVGEIIATHCAHGVVSGHRMAHQAMNSLGRIAGRSHCRTGDKFNA